MTEEPSPQGFRILVIVSRPLDLPDLPNLADQWALQGGLRRVQAPAYLKMLRPPTVEGLRSEILNGYDIVHFDGHGAFGRRCPNCGASMRHSRRSAAAAMLCLRTKRQKATSPSSGRTASWTPWRRRSWRRSS